MKPSYKTKLKDITTFIFDIDGVLTDGIILLHPSGEFLRNMSVKDGYALRKAVTSGYNVFIISGGESKSMKERLKYLGIKEVFMSVKDKSKIYKKLKKKYSFTNNQVVYMGDDIPDIEVLEKVGVATCPKDAVQEVKEVCSYISHYEGGKGAARDIIQQVLKVQDKWMKKDNLQAN